MTRASRDDSSNLERLAVWKKKGILLGGLDLMMWIVSGRLSYGVRRS
jgi:hypothetical protein